jgi:hypothetical protein
MTLQSLLLRLKNEFGRFGIRIVLVEMPEDEPVKNKGEDEGENKIESEGEDEIESEGEVEDDQEQDM